MIPDDIVVLEPTSRKKGSRQPRQQKPIIGPAEELHVLETFEKQEWPEKIHYTQEQFWALFDRCPDGKTPLDETPDETPEGGWDEGKYGWVSLWQKSKKRDAWFRPNKGVHVTEDGTEIVLRGFSIAKLKEEDDPRTDQAQARLAELRGNTAEAEVEAEAEKPKPRSRPRKKKN